MALPSQIPAFNSECILVVCLTRPKKLGTIARLRSQSQKVIEGSCLNTYLDLEIAKCFDSFKQALHQRNDTDGEFIQNQRHSKLQPHESQVLMSSSFKLLFKHVVKGGSILRWPTT